MVLYDKSLNIYKGDDIMFDLDSCTAFITNQTAKKLCDNFNDKLMALGSTRVQWIALFYLGKDSELSQKELAKLMNIKGSTVARLVDRLEIGGYVKRKKDIKDRRITNLELTYEGKKLRESLLPEGEKFSKLIARNITEEEMETFIKVLRIMAENIS